MYGLRPGYLRLEICYLNENNSPAFQVATISVVDTLDLA